jgi:phytoene dehydrogenase-like protein
MLSMNDDNLGPDLIVVGGGLAGLMTAALVARARRKVVVIERSSRPGGRAITQVEGGIHFNLGPHALYCHGQAFRLLEELDIRYTGRFPDARRGLLTDRSRSYALPLGIASLIGSRLLTLREKARSLGLFTALPRLNARDFDRVPLEDWIRQSAGAGNLARLIRTLFRVSTYVDDPRRLSAGAAIDQLKLALSGNVWYLDDGWQVLVDGLRDRLWDQSVDFRTGCRAESVCGDAGGVTVELTSGEVLRGRTAVLAIDPEGAVDLLRRPADAPLASWTARCIPVRAASLDVALSRLPRPHRRVAFDLDRPLYFSVHSASARLAPEGVAVLHVMKYLGAEREDPGEVEQEFEAFLESLQPGWRTNLVARRFLPRMTVGHSLPRPEEGGLAGRPGVEVEGCPNVFLAGDWVGPEGMLADASAASAREAARRVFNSITTRPSRAGGSVAHATA